ncbi:hypothetical protein [Mycobacterium stomatepiae]|uniref:IrrE N-terminal-like domain-containing protein n=1 Tax=Mycobacterium stomatepiae TaxID=470076 RepID=A0A7I7Q6V0_9MYCO|nr:hypothetical protein [Mycobacterium stomatepiae]MCV7163182.1 hypothetical protein [Mycobacterium stomatepiae]BBY22048.1 hypothetical protein MSTO_22530 [Mycobacterium stomatepiae]
MTTPDTELLALARRMPIPVPWDRHQFVDNVARMRGRPIRLIPTPTPALAGSPCGLWLKRDTDDVIVHDIGTSEYHMDQIVCHEIGHMVLGHDQPHISEPPGSAHSRMCATLLPDLDPATVRSVLGRTDYASAQERDAETFASVLMIAAADAGAQRSVMRSVFFRSR